MEKYYIWLLMIFGVANPKIHTVINYYGNAEAACLAISDGQTKFLNDTELLILSSVKLEKAEKLYNDFKKKKIGMLTIDDTQYPELLKNIFNPPVMLFYRGNIDGLNDEIVITAVGTRNPTTYSKKLAYRVCSDLAKLGVVLVSGMALGLDSVAHLSAVENNARTIGVLACGVDVNYPKGSAALRKRIVDAGGAYISEIFPNDLGGKGYFHQRNRILAGLSLGTIVLEASMISGALITASHAVSQSRDLFCIPPADVFDPAYAGVVRFLRDGAIPLFNHYDVINQYYWRFAEKLANAKIEDKLSVKPENTFVFDKTKPESALTSSNRKRRTASVQAPREEPETEEGPTERNYDGLSENQLKIVAYLKSGSHNIDEIQAQTELSYAELSEALIEMEMNELLAYKAGANYELI